MLFPSAGATAVSREATAPGRQASRGFLVCLAALQCSVLHGASGPEYAVPGVRPTPERA